MASPRLLFLALLAASAGYAAAATEAQDAAIGELKERGLACGACKYVISRLDDQIKAHDVPALPQKKARKWLRKHFKVGSLCGEKRFPISMGILRGHNNTAPNKIVENAVEYAKSAGWGRNDPTEIQRVYDGTHESLYMDRTIGAKVAIACPALVEGQLAPLAAKLEDLFMDGEGVLRQVCVEQLGLCPLEHGEL